MQYIYLLLLFYHTNAVGLQDTSVLVSRYANFQHRHWLGMVATILNSSFETATIYLPIKYT